jgi:hypothetical protein
MEKTLESLINIKSIHLDETCLFFKHKQKKALEIPFAQNLFSLIETSSVHEKGLRKLYLEKVHSFV